MSRPCGSERWLTITSIAILLATQSGCVASQKLAVEDQRAIHTIYVDTAVTVPEKPMLLTRGEAFALGLGAGLGGAVGGAIVGSAASSGGTPSQQFVAYLNDNHIRIDEMLLAAFVDEANKRQLFQIVPSADTADAVLKLEVRDYGLGYTANMFSHDYRASLTANGALTRSGGKVVWRKLVAEQAMLANWPAASLHDLFAQPELLRTQMAAASSTVAQELVEDLAGTKR